MFQLNAYFIGAFAFRSELQSVRLYQSTDGLYISVMAAEITYFLFILYYMCLQVNFNMLNELLSICSIYVSVCLRLQRFLVREMFAEGTTILKCFTYLQAGFYEAAHIYPV